MTEPEKKKGVGFTGFECEGCLYISIGVIIGCLIIGFIIWQLAMLGQILGVVLGIITFGSLLATFFAHFSISSRGDNPSLAFKLKVAATILFFVFLIEAIHTIVVFWTPILYPVVQSLLASVNLSTDGGLVLILVGGFFLVIIAAFFSIPVCLWTSICRSSKEKDEISPQTTPLSGKEEEKIRPTKCPTCGVKLGGDEKFCGNCGVAIDSNKI
ncbi:MAG: zinc ribbon domain-containing protein [Candidatus Hermodarchaeota archaeon]